jgi:hypothetical protein
VQTADQRISDKLLEGREGVWAMLVKTAVARKLLAHAWKNNLSLRYSAIYRIDAPRHFGAAVDACLFVCAFAMRMHSHDCTIYADIDENAAPVGKLGWRDGEMVADIERFERWRHLPGQSGYKWRSGVKHDCAKVMELEYTSTGCVNGFGEPVDIEDTYLFRMLKTSEVAKHATASTRAMLVTQRSIGERTTSIRETAPKTWAYLERHSVVLDKRAGTIYEKRSRFSVFGVGDYSFSPLRGCHSCRQSKRCQAGRAGMPH